jgi:glycosyltransferase involved in cell wall biosynthesis
MEAMVLLFITRKFPPSRGGMEKVAFELSNHLSALINVKIVKYGGSNKWLPIVIPYLLARAIGILLTKHIDVIYLEDGLLSPLGLILKLFRKPVVITIHGRDIAYDNVVYQMIIPRCLKRLSRVICVSNAIKDQCLKRGINNDKLVVIPNGISDEYYLNGQKQAARNKLERVLGITFGNKKILLSVGRFVKKKGIHWFLTEVMPKLSKADCVYVIAGDGVMSPLIKQIISDNNLGNSVMLTGWANTELLKILYNSGDIFVMPNIPVDDDMEGFGLVALETASCGLPVVASNLEGITEAIKDGKNGFLIEPGNASEYFMKLSQLLKDDIYRINFGAQARHYTLENYGWEKMAELYLGEFSKLE